MQTTAGFHWVGFWLVRIAPESVNLPSVVLFGGCQKLGTCTFYCQLSKTYPYKPNKNQKLYKSLCRGDNTFGNVCPSVSDPLHTPLPVQGLCLCMKSVVTFTAIHQSITNGLIIPILASGLLGHMTGTEDLTAHRHLAKSRNIITNCSDWWTALTEMLRFFWKRVYIHTYTDRWQS